MALRIGRSPQDKRGLTGDVPKRFVFKVVSGAANEVSELDTLLKLLATFDLSNLNPLKLGLTLLPALSEGAIGEENNLCLLGVDSGAEGWFPVKLKVGISPFVV